MKRTLGLLFLIACAGTAGAQTFFHVESQFDEVAGVDGLNFAWAVAVSPDGKHVYVCSGVNNVASMDEDDNAVATFAADPKTGMLTFVESDFDDGDANDPGTADGLLSCRGVTVSPDGKHVYTAGSSDNKVGLFDRSAMTGALTFVAAVADGVGGVDGLAGAEAVVVSPDGSAVFVAGRADDAIAAFSRNATTGALTFEDFEKNGFGGVSGLDRPLGLAVSPDNKHVYAASGSNANFAGSDALTVFEWDAGNGDLIFIDAYFEGDTQGLNTIDGLDQISDVAISPDGLHVYAVSENDTIGGASGNGNDWIAIFERNAATGELTWLDAIPGFKVCPTSPFGADAESFIVISPDGRRVYVTKNWADNGIAMFRRDPATGALSFLDGICELDPGEIGISLPREMALDPRGAYLYVAGNASDAVGVLDTGLLGDGFESAP